MSNPLIEAITNATPEQIEELLARVNPDEPHAASITLAWNDLQRPGPQFKVKRERGHEAYGTTLGQAIQALRTEGYL